MANDKKKPSIASQGAVMRRVLRYPFDSIL